MRGGSGANWRGRDGDLAPTGGGGATVLPGACAQPSPPSPPAHRPSGPRSRHRPVPAAALGACEPAPMDRYVVKRPAGEAGGGGGGGKRPRAEEPVPGQPRWREIRAEGLSCDYRLLFGKAEADEIFRQLEEEVEYFQGEGPRRSRRAAPCRVSLPRAGAGGLGRAVRAGAGPAGGWCWQSLGLASRERGRSDGQGQFQPVSAVPPTF